MIRADYRLHADDMVCVRCRLVFGQDAMQRHRRACTVMAPLIGPLPPCNWCDREWLKTHRLRNRHYCDDACTVSEMRHELDEARLAARPKLKECLYCGVDFKPGPGLSRWNKVYCSAYCKFWADAPTRPCVDCGAEFKVAPTDIRSLRCRGCAAAYDVAREAVKEAAVRRRMLWPRASRPIRSLDPRNHGQPDWKELARRYDQRGLFGRDAFGMTAAEIIAQAMRIYTKTERAEIDQDMKDWFVRSHRERELSHLGAMLRIFEEVTHGTHCGVTAKDFEPLEAIRGRQAHRHQRKGSNQFRADGARQPEG